MFIYFESSSYNTIPKTTNINQEIAQLKRILKKAANASNGLSRTPKHRQCPVSFNSYVSYLIRLRKKSWKTFKKIRYSSNYLGYKMACSKVK